MKSDLHFTKTGSGKKFIVLFHGFGQTNQALDDWVPLLSKQFTVYAFDLYYHGQSVRRDARLSTEEWKVDFEHFLQNENIDRFSIGAYSLGGRFALTTVNLFPEHVDNLLLVAPDGIFRSVWFNIATSTVGNPFFKYLMLHPLRFNQLLKLVEQIHLATSQMVRFAQKELAVKENRKKVYRSWTYFKPLQPDLQLFKQVVYTHKIQVNLVLGSKDHIIPQREVLAKISGINQLITHILEAKHHQLIEAAKTLIPSLLKEGNL